MKNQIKLYKVNNLAYQSYVSFTKGNFNLSIEEVQKKLTRNIMLGVKIKTLDEKYVWYAYGHMRILVKNEKKIVMIMNQQPLILGWEKDEALRKWLDKKLGIAVDN